MYYRLVLQGGNMNKNNLLRSSFFVKAALFILVLFSATTLTNAQGVTFAQFFQRDDGSSLNDFTFTNRCPINATFSTGDGGTPIVFTYQNIDNLPAELQGPQNARLFITASTTAPATSTVIAPGTRLAQPFNETFTIRIIRDTAATVGTGSRTNLLTAVTSFSSIAGQAGANSGSYDASTPNQTITFSSDFLNFSNTASRNLALSFSSITPVLSIGLCDFLASFTAAGTGTFAANQAPLSSTPPTSAGVVLSGRVLGAKGRTGLANARVNMTNSEGETVTVMTNSSGYYRFTDVEVGQAVVISVTSKRYIYAPKVVNVGEDLVGLDFFPE
jgi:hypothetical protein